MIKGPGLGRDASLRAIRRSGILLTFVRDVTHSGCNPFSLFCCVWNKPSWVSDLYHFSFITTQSEFVHVL
ncbi:putative ribosomal protein S11 [Helianthus annuus]|uniref:Ribosomal protein S11 n=1 Tax=Helianthus annuus TaxID=4232 RepID=A0A9K3JKA4_HELAN|nr:putative ribosomal protein S11 [Helianthus annuus]KAJ0594849.1 putative ribosomal protein S11 [Helianthus annuus]KAJ0603159.1 putative ribosomal protein S11 [Helianthus annuus]KAJ0609892.1 putative ribosomal protein S11 [Helianthus annuus]KAJ0775665.1 putative ribosomal protein S11 [Helianthus annuus]